MSSANARSPRASLLMSTHSRTWMADTPTSGGTSMMSANLDSTMQAVGEAEQPGSQ